MVLSIEEKERREKLEQVKRVKRELLGPFAGFKDTFFNGVVRNLEDIGISFYHSGMVTSVEDGKSLVEGLDYGSGAVESFAFSDFRQQSLLIERLNPGEDGYHVFLSGTYWKY